MLSAWKNLTAPRGVIARGESGMFPFLFAEMQFRIGSKYQLFSFKSWFDLIRSSQTLYTHTHTHFSERLLRITASLDACQNMLQHQVFCFFPMYHCGDSARCWTHREIQVHDAQVFLENNPKALRSWKGLFWAILAAWISGRGKRW